jgi:aryl-alcohol dehydrogenase-like predicted oxidoreductase
MTNRTLWNGAEIPALGLGCWAIGGPFYAGDTPLGWGEVDDVESVRAIHNAVELGIRFFDTAPIYGTGRSEEVLGRALAAHPEVLIGTKLGVGMNPATRQIEFTDEATTAQALTNSIDASLRRLRRERIDLVHLHLNSFAIDKAAVVFDTLETLRAAGKIDAFGWSTDYPDRAAAFAKRPGFVSIQHAMNVFFRASDLMPVIEQHGLLSINRSPLAMGFLSGKYRPGKALPANDIRSQTMDWMAYFKDGKPSPSYTRQLDAVRELLSTDGRTLVQGALAWLWARSARTLPIPGFRTAEQVQDLAGALGKGPLPADVMSAIERSIVREPEGPPRDR